MVALVVFGLFALFRLKTDEFPDVAPPFVTVGIPYPGRVARRRGEGDPRPDRGADRLDHRREAGRRQGVRRLRLHHRRVQFGKDLARGDAGPARRDLGDPRPTCRRRWRSRSSGSSTTPTGRSSRWRSRRASLSPAELTRLADPGDHPRAARRSPAWPRCWCRGKVERELTVELEPAAMQAAGVSVGQVVQALQLQNLAAPVGRVTGDSTSAPSGSGAGCENAAGVRAARRRRARRQLMRLGEVATVRDGTEEPRTLALFNERRRRSASTSRSRRATAPPTSATSIRERVAQLQQTLPAGHEARAREGRRHARGRAR